jgi:hypothetical protein
MFEGNDVTVLHCFFITWAHMSAEVKFKESVTLMCESLFTEADRFSTSHLGSEDCRFGVYKDFPPSTQMHA